MVAGGGCCWQARRWACGRGEQVAGCADVAVVGVAEGVAGEESVVLYVVSSGGRAMVGWECRGSAPNFLNSDR